ncbi:hypothetical protein POM88_019797 [Heracleum sosnowskyi]|uniref:Uncharacterized protein n=1 Tax=Heracleum sosnowskyi TaxID=360622 RepID=A0AAD8ICL3_9APIA|nr:hypothetical protein POM88_019797 [Heracleum sosnowskyi]
MHLHIYQDGTGDSLPKIITKEKREKRLLENYLQQQQMETTEKKNDIDVYLAEEPQNPMIDKFDILLWWKENAGSWLKTSHGGIKSDIYLDETNTYQFLEHEEDNMGKVKDNATSNENTKTRGKTINVTVIDD